MKKSAKPPATAATDRRANDAVAQSEARKSADPGVGDPGKADPGTAGLGIAERRHFIRPLPVPDAVESDGDTDWATFQALISEKPKD
jgi:hypothetical protein